MCKTLSQAAFALALSFALIVPNCNAQLAINSYQQVYSGLLKGGSVMIGNTSMAIKKNDGTINTTKMNEISNASNGQGGIGYTQYGNDDENMQFVDIDGVTATGNSSSADLILPAGTNTIKFARLYWGGRIDNAAISAKADTLQRIKIRKGTSGAYSPILAPVGAVDKYAITTTETVYQCFSDVTSFIQSQGPGTYTVADLPATPGSVSGGGKYGGWMLEVAYENLAQPLNSVRIYHGYYQVYNGGASSNVTVTLGGLNVPNNSLNSGDAVMSVMGWEGDGNLGASSGNPQGDFLKVNTVAVANAANKASNFWNGSISKNGAYVTTKNPDYSNQMGIDIDEVNVGTGYGILPNATSVDVTFGTEADQYFPSAFTFQIRVKDPLVSIDKTVSDQNNNGTVETTEELTYSLTGSNIGPGVATNVFIVDTLPTNVTYVANSMVVLSGPGMTLGAQSDAQGAGDNSFKAVFGGKTYLKFFAGTGSTPTAGGTMQVGDAYSVKFKVKGQAIPGSVSNTATSYAYSVAGDLFTDYSTAVISPSGGPLPVTLLAFTANFNNDKSQGLIHWVTDNETGNKSFTVERSTDGLHFTDLGTINGNGTTRTQHAYDYTDDLTSVGGNVLYYRLKITSVDGQISYSQIVLLKLDNSLISVTNMRVYPNPFVDNVKVFVTSKDRVTTDFSILTIDGKRVSTQKIQVEKGNNIVVLQKLGNLPNGNYLLEVNSGTERYIMKLVKN